MYHHQTVKEPPPKAGRLQPLRQVLPSGVTMLTSRGSPILPPTAASAQLGKAPRQLLHAQLQGPQKAESQFDLCIFLISILTQCPHLCFQDWPFPPHRAPICALCAVCVLPAMMSPAGGLQTEARAGR